MTRSNTPARRHAVRAIAVTAAVGLATTVAATAGGGPAGASAVYAQSVGRFLDGAAGGRPIQALVDLHDARAAAPGTATEQNPLEATLLGQAEIPLGHKLQQPGGGVFHLGAAQQVAVARDNGYSYGASGAIRNSGGASLGGSNHAYPADATITLSSDSFGSVPVPGLPTIPGLPTPPGLPNPGDAPALGGLQARIGAVAALASTRAGGAFTRPRYEIAGLTLTLDSPALAQLVQTLQGGNRQFGALAKKLQKVLDKLSIPMPPQCSPASASVPMHMSIDGGAVMLNAAKATITVDVANLLRQLGADLNALPPNTDLMAFLANNLGRILSRGLENVVNGVIDPMQQYGKDCFSALPAPLPGLVQKLSDGQQQLEGAINQVADQLSGAGAPGLKQLTDGLAQAADIGVNVQQGAFPLASEHSARFAYDSPLAATPDQATPVVSGQGVVRAIELDLGGSGASIALGNAAAGPSSPAPAPAVHHRHRTAATAAAAPTAIPTGVPAGEAGGGAGGGTPLLPIVVLLIGLSAAGGGALAYRFRGKLSR